MNFRGLLKELENQNLLEKIDGEYSIYVSAAKEIAKRDGKAVFLRVKESDIPVVGGVYSSRKAFQIALECKDRMDVTKKIAQAMDNLSEPEKVSHSPAQEIVMDNISKIPILQYLPGDGGRYITSGVFIIRDPELGRNACYHRMMVLDDKHFVVRVVKNRGTDTAFQKVDELEAAVVFGAPPSLMIAAATSIPKDQDELCLANAMDPFKITKAKSVDVDIPTDCEIVIEGKLIKEYTDEGPFLDLTETYDIIRKQPIFEVKKVTMRKDAIYHALLPGKMEHKLLMGLPREATIYKEVSKVCECLDAYLSLGGCSWLHGIVKIRKRSEEDGKKAIEAAFKGHGSMKHVVIVDEDTNVEDPNQIEWSIATRVQATRDVYIFPDQPGSSLDPSAKHVPGQKSRTDKIGIDATIPLDKDKSKFKKVVW